MHYVLLFGMLMYNSLSAVLWCLLQSHWISYSMDQYNALDLVFS